MTILNPTTTEHTLKLACRDYSTELTLTIRDDYTKETTTPFITASKSGSFTTISFTHYLTEGKWYAITLRDSNNIPVYRGKVFATSETNLSQYQMLKGKYEADVISSNKFMTL